MPTIKIGTSTYGDEPQPIVLMQGRATRDAEDKPVNGKDHAVVGIAANEDEHGNTIYINLNGWRENAALVLAIRKGDSVLAVGRLTTREHNGKTYYNVDADFVALSGAGLLRPAKSHRRAKSPVDVSAEDFDDSLGDLPDADGFTELNDADDAGELPF